MTDRKFTLVDLVSQSRLSEDDWRARNVIYKIACLVNGKAYVGQTRKKLRNRYGAHLMSAADPMCQHLLARAMRRHGVEKFSIEIIERCGSVAELNARERYWIAELDSLAPNGYNVATGGGVGEVRVPEVGAKISAAMQGKVKSLEWRAALSRSHKGKVLTPEWRHSIGLAQTGRKDTDDTRRKKSEALKGKSRLPRESDAARNANISAALTGKKLSKNTILKMAIANAGSKWINDGVNSRKLNFAEELPEGWTYGRTPFKYRDRVRGVKK